jgi:hypothetical protein
MQVTEDQEVSQLVLERAFYLSAVNARALLLSTSSSVLLQRFVLVKRESQQATDLRLKGAHGWYRADCGESAYVMNTSAPLVSCLTLGCRVSFSPFMPGDKR